MNAIQLLTQQHREMTKRFKALEEAAKEEKKNYRKLLAEAAFLLLDHMEAEERVFYPALSKHDPKVLEGIEEHNVMKPLLQAISLLPVEDETVPAKVDVLSELNEHHMKEEEEDLFPKFKEHFSEKELEALGAKVQETLNLLAKSR